MYNFKRPKSVSYPQVYYRFKAKDKHSENVVEYRVQDLPAERFEEAVEFLVKNFLPYETICSSVNSHLNPAFCDHISKFWMKEISENLSIACFKDDGSSDLVAVNVFVVKSQDDEEIDAVDANQDQTVADVLGVLGYCAKQFDVCKHFKVDRFLTAYGLCVNPEYRGRGIATEMLKARVPYMKAFGLQVTSTSFTGIGSQTAAKKAGYQEAFVIPYSEIGLLFPRFDFSNSATKMYKTMTLLA